MFLFQSIRFRIDRPHQARLTRLASTGRPESGINRPKGRRRYDYLALWEWLIGEPGRIGPDDPWFPLSLSLVRIDQSINFYCQLLSSSIQNITPDTTTTDRDPPRTAVLWSGVWIACVPLGSAVAGYHLSGPSGTAGMCFLSTAFNEPWMLKECMQKRSRFFPCGGLLARSGCNKCFVCWPWSLILSLYLGD